MLGFLLGLMASVCEGEPAERRSAAILRGFFGCLLFLALFLGMQGYLRDGRVVLALIYLVGAGAAAGLLAQPRVGQDERDDRRQTA